MVHEGKYFASQEKFRLPAPMLVPGVAMLDGETHDMRLGMREASL